MDEFYLYQHDDRTVNEIELTNNLSRALSTLNLKRVQQQKFPIQSLSSKNDYLYVCFPGIPLIPNQFQNIGIPGEKMIIYYQGYQPGISEDQAKQKIKYSRFQQQAAIIHQRLSKRKDKPLVFIYHSFGTILAVTFLRLYYSDYVNRVIGLIGLGSFPLRFTKFIKSGIQVISSDKSIDYLLNNVDQIYNKLIERYKQYGRNDYDKNKYSYLCRVTALTQGIGFKEMFSYMRQLPPILKCFIYGREDQIISEPLLNEVAVYYTYKRKLQSTYQQKTRQIFAQMHGVKVDSVQERFIFNIPQGKHSLHAQKKFSKLISSILNQYLQVIEKLQK